MEPLFAVLFLGGYGLWLLLFHGLLPWFVVRRWIKRNPDMTMGGLLVVGAMTPIVASAILLVALYVELRVEAALYPEGEQGRALAVLFMALIINSILGLPVSLFAAWRVWKKRPSNPAETFE